MKYYPVLRYYLPLLRLTLELLKVLISLTDYCWRLLII